MSILDPQDHPSLLANAEQAAIERGLYNFPIVDADAHHYEFESWDEIAEFIERPSVKRLAGNYHMLDQVMPGSLGDRRIGGRLKRDKELDYDRGDGVPKLVHKFRHTTSKMGIDYSIIFPTQMLVLGLHPQPDMEVAIARAYARWLTEKVLPTEPGVLSMLYLPFNDPDASLKMVEEFGDKPGVVGFMVTSTRYATVTHNKYMKVFRAIEERGLPLAFHPLFHWQDRSLEQLDCFLSVHALGFPLYNMIHLTNVVIGGLPERFPNLKFVFMEAGLSYLVFLAHRLDSEYRMRRSEAPLLKKKPSDYMRDFYYTIQPMEFVDMKDLKYIFDLMNGKTQFLYASDYPHWDFDPPSRIYDLPFLNEEEKRAVLGGNAMELFQIEQRKVKVAAG